MRPVGASNSRVMSENSVVLPAPLGPSSAVTFGISAFNPIRIGGEAQGVPRVVKYLTALRGPAGQGIRYRDAGQALAGPKGGLVQRIDVEYAGLPQPVRLYFDTTREEPLLAPQGFLCVAPLVVR